MESSGFYLPHNFQRDRSPNFTVSVLENSIEFYLEYAFIIRSVNYHLFVRTGDSVLMDRYFNTEGEAKEAFLGDFKDKGWRPHITPSWSQYFVPDFHWIEYLLSDFRSQTVNF